ncbi:HNH endonuclease [Streptomyces sp. NPDC057137]|uniref:HNH endonuclease n=1 Tax=Streptomyces sp. NPDC057137 TaxID=3346030 RepID=UPI00362B5398
MTHLHLVHGCPSWCTVDDHSTAPADDRVHLGKTHELRLPDGRLVLDATLSQEPDRTRPSLVVSGSLDMFGLDVMELDVAEAHALVGQLQSFLHKVQHTLNPLKGKQPPAKKLNPGKAARAAWRETRMYLAERDGWQCFYCRSEFDTLRGVSVDHYVPKSLWPCNLPANLVLACAPCNSLKDDALPRIFAALFIRAMTGVEVERAA